MNAVQQPAVTLVQGAATPRAERRSQYFLGTSILLLAIVLIGFSRTLFLRPLFQVPAIPWYVYVHGSVMAAWFVLFVAQTSLVAAHHTGLHRRLGVLSAVLAVAVVALGIWLTLSSPALFTASGGASTTIVGESVPVQQPIQFLWGNLGTMALFAALVATALWQRRRPEVHKRLMLLASIAMIGPAAGRITEFPVLSGAAPTAPVNTWVLTLIVALVVGLPLSLVAHDLLTARRLHRVTFWGLLAFFAVQVGTRVVAGTAAGPALWKALE